MTDPDVEKLIERCESELHTYQRFGRVTCEQALAAIRTLSAENARLKAELDRRDRNETRNCLNWGPCSQHDERMVSTLNGGQSDGE